MPWGRQSGDVKKVGHALREAGAATVAVSGDLGKVETPATIFDAVEADLGPVTALIMCHCESVDSSLLETTIDSFDRHFAVNTRASWLLIREFALRYAGPISTKARRQRRGHAERVSQPHPDLRSGRGLHDDHRSQRDGDLFEIGVVEGDTAPVIVHAMRAREKFLR